MITHPPIAADLASHLRILLAFARALTRHAATTPPLLAAAADALARYNREAVIITPPAAEIKKPTAGPVMTAREWIQTAAENDRAALIEGIQSLFNCREADVDGCGDVYICDPQRGHWLDDEGLEKISRAIETAYI